MANGVLIVRWSLGGAVDSGFRSNDSAAQDDFIDAARALIANRRRRTARRLTQHQRSTLMSEPPSECKANSGP